MTEVVSQRPIPAWKRQANSSIPEESRKVVAIFNKISPSTVSGFISQILSINVLENPDEEAVTPQDGARMKPIVDAILNKLKDKESHGFIKMYSYLIASLMSEWRGRQKNIFKRLVLETFENYLTTFNDLELSETPSVKDRQVAPFINILTVLFVVATRNNENIIPIHIAFKALYMFTGQDEKKLEVFRLAFFRCYDIMKGHPLFDKFFRKLILDNLEACFAMESISMRLRFFCKDLIVYIESGKLSPVLQDEKNDMDSNQFIL